MQEIELGLFVVAALGIIVFVVLKARDTVAERPRLVAALIGIVPGILGAVVVLVPRTDLIPDVAEPVLWLVVGVIATAFAMIALTFGYARR